MIGMGLFMSFIIVLVLKMTFSPEDALIDKNYYEKGQNYDVEYNAKQKAIQDNVVPNITVDDSGLKIRFEQPVEYRLTAKRPSDIKMDKRFEGVTNEPFTLHLSQHELAKGPWALSLEFSVAKEKYLVQDEIIMP